MTAKQEIIRALNIIAPEKLAEPWDNCGMQIDLGKQSFDKILVCLEITRAVIEEAKSQKADLIVTHHPLYFKESKNIIRGTLPSDYTIELIKNDISVYSAHTSFDKAEGGNNTELCEMLGLIDVEKMYEGSGEDDYIGYMGLINDKAPIRAEDFAEKVREALGITAKEIRLIGEADHLIYKVGVCTGAGADLAFTAQGSGCDVLVTGDVKYHDAQIAKENGMVIIDAGHYGTEAIFAPNMADKLRTILGTQADIIVSEININPFI